MRSCKSCGIKFSPTFNTIQKACSVKCAIELAGKTKAKVFKARTRKLKTIRRENDRSWHLETLQREFNRYIRLRDKLNPCISCGTTADVQYAAGHYRTVGAAPELRFNEDNCHKQCNRNCNQGLSGNIREYRPNLIKKIGLAKVEEIEGPHKPMKYTIPELKDMIKLYRAKIKAFDPADEKC